MYLTHILSNELYIGEEYEIVLIEQKSKNSILLNPGLIWLSLIWFGIVNFEYNMQNVKNIKQFCN